MGDYGKWMWSDVSESSVRPHVHAWQEFMQVPVPMGSDGFRCCIHHIDQDITNNDILNLVCMEKTKHDSWHDKYPTASRKAKIVASLMGNTRRRGKTQSVLSRARISQSQKTSPKAQAAKKALAAKMRGQLRGADFCAKQEKRWSDPLVCPHCGKEGKGPQMYRYHFNNCIFKNERRTTSQ